MGQRNLLRKNGGTASIAVNRFFYNTRDRQKYLGRRGELVVDMCECAGETDDNGDPVVVAKLYVHDGKTCGGITVAAAPCPDTAGDLCAQMNEFPELGTIEGINLPETLCEVMNAAPNLGVLDA